MSTYHKYNYEVTKEVEEQLKKHWLKLVDYYCKFGSFVIDEAIYNECIEESVSFIETDDLVRECFKHDFKKRVYRNNKNRTYY